MIALQYWQRQRAFSSRAGGTRNEICSFCTLHSPCQSIAVTFVCRLTFELMSSVAYSSFPAEPLY